MPYIRARGPYTKKPPSGVSPNWGHPLAKHLQVWIPFTEGAGIPHAYINGVRRAADGATFSGTPAWINETFGRAYRFQTGAAGDSWLYWNWINSIGAGNFEYLVAAANKATNSSAYTAGIGTYAPGLINQDSATRYRWYWGGSNNIPTGLVPAVGDFVIGNVRRKGTGTNESFAEVVKDRGGVRSGVLANTEAGSIGASTTFTLNASRSSGQFSGHNSFAYYWMALWSRTLPDSAREMLYHNPDAIWQIYSRPLPTWIASGAAPPVGWSNTMNEIASPGAVNEIENANIQAVNEI